MILTIFIYLILVIAASGCSILDEGMTDIAMSIKIKEAQI